MDFSERHSQGHPIDFFTSRSVSVATHPFLRSHVLGNKYVVPAAIMVEWILAGIEHRYTPHVPIGVSQFSVAAGLKLSEHEVSMLDIEYSSPVSNDATSLQCQARIYAQSGGSRKLFVAEVVVDLCCEQRTSLELAGTLNGDPEVVKDFDSGTVYSDMLFHGPYFQGLREIKLTGSYQMQAQIVPGADPKLWMTQPHRESWITDPRVLDSAGQLAIVWLIAKKGLACLPIKLAKMDLLPGGFSKKSKIYHAYTEITYADEHRLLSNISVSNESGEIVARLTDLECVVSRSILALFNLKSRT